MEVIGERKTIPGPLCDLFLSLLQKQCIYPTSFFFSPISALSHSAVSIISGTFFSAPFFSLRSEAPSIPLLPPSACHKKLGPMFGILLVPRPWLPPSTAADRIRRRSPLGTIPGASEKNLRWNFPLFNLTWRKRVPWFFFGTKAEEEAKRTIEVGGISFFHRWSSNDNVQPTIPGAGTEEPGTIIQKNFSCSFFL